MGILYHGWFIAFVLVEFVWRLIKVITVFERLQKRQIRIVLPLNLEKHEELYEGGAAEWIELDYKSKTFIFKRNSSNTRVQTSVHRGMPNRILSKTPTICLTNLTKKMNLLFWRFRAEMALI